eukprot:136108_1
MTLKHKETKYDHNVNIIQNKRNINQICICQEMLKEGYWRYNPNGWKCECCHKTYSGDVKIYYWCRKQTCGYTQITKSGFVVCFECFNTFDNLNDDNKNYCNKHNFVSAKITSIINIINKEINKLTDSKQCKRYMFDVYHYLYINWINKLKTNQYSK